MARKDFLIVEIDSSSVGVVRYAHTAEQQIVSASRTHFSTLGAKNSAAAVSLLTDAIKKELASIPPHSSSACAVFVGSPWYFLELQTLQAEVKSPSTFSERSVEDLLSRARKEHADKSVIPLNVRVNGYSTKMKKPLIGTTLECDSAIIQIEPELVQAITPLLAPYAERGAVQMFPSPIAAADTLLQIDDTQYGTVISIHKESTDMVIVSGHTIGFVASVPIGSNTILTSMSTSGVDILSRLELLARGKLAQSEASALTGQLMDASSAWIAAVRGLLESAQNTIPVSHHFTVLTSDSDWGWLESVCNQISPEHPTRSRNILSTLRDQSPLPKSISDGSLAAALSTVKARLQSNGTLNPKAGMLYSLL